MIIDIKIPSPGESITEVELTNWLVADGDYVEKDQELAEVESDKATLPVIAEQAGKVIIKVTEGTTIKVGEIACSIDTNAKKQRMSQGKIKSVDKTEVKTDIKKKVEVKKEAEAEVKEKESLKNVKASPLAKKMMQENSLDVADIINGLKRISKSDVEAVLQSKQLSGLKVQQEATRDEEREKISSLRRKLSQRLVDVKNETAMLTTFNEVDMSYVMDIRKKYQQAFIDKHGIKLGFMSFFTKAVSVALQLYSKVNSMIDGEGIITPKYTDISIAVQTEKGLMVPVIRNVETLSLADIEHKIKDLADKARRFRLPIEDMSGGTFSITNGGVFGSMLSTPILNPPQSAILGMHNIVERPVAVNGKVEIRPVMYIALSYDHRIIDGKDSVGFLYKVKELIENPTMLLTGGETPEKTLLEI